MAVQRISSNTAPIFAFLALMVFWVFYFVVGQAATVEIASSLVLGASAAIALTWLPAAVWSVRDGARDGESMLAIGMTTLATSIFLQRAWIILLRWMDRPAWMIESPVSAFSAWMIFCSCALIILAPGTVGGEVPSRNWIYVTMAIAFGALIAGITIGAYMVAGAGINF